MVHHNMVSNMPSKKRSDRKGTPLPQQCRHAYQDSPYGNSSDGSHIQESASDESSSQNKRSSKQNTYNQHHTRDVDASSHILVRSELIIGKRIASFLSLADVESIVTFHDTLEEYVNVDIEESPERYETSYCMHCSSLIQKQKNLSYDSIDDYPGLPMEQLDDRGDDDSERYLSSGPFPLSRLFDEDKVSDEEKSNIENRMQRSDNSTDNIPGTIEADSDDEDENDTSFNERISFQAKIVTLKDKYRDHCDVQSMETDLASLIFSIPLSIRSYIDTVIENLHEKSNDCRHDSYSSNSYNAILCSECSAYLDTISPEVLREPGEIQSIPKSKGKRLRALRRRAMLNKRNRVSPKQHRTHSLVHNVFRLLFQNVPLSILFDIFEGILDINFNTFLAVQHVTSTSFHMLVSSTFSLIGTFWREICALRPSTLFDVICDLHYGAMGRTSEAFDHTCQSASAAIHMIRGHSSHGLSVRGNGQYSSRSSLFGGFRRSESNRNINEKLVRKLSKIDSTSRVLSYMEWEEDKVLSQKAKAKVQRMMHYEVSLRPFVATVSVAGVTRTQQNRPAYKRLDDIGLVDHHDFSLSTFDSQLGTGDAFESDEYSNSADTNEETSTSLSCVTSDSPFMCTPKSFPVTPSSRKAVMARTTRFSEDVIYLARDQLRVENALVSHDSRTRNLAKSLREYRRLAVFNAADTASGILLTLGQHCATKVGNVLYCSTRSMIPILRNDYVYFEMSIAPDSGLMQMASLAIGLSTTEMPLNTFVGAWKSSIGLCTTGQILNAGQWCAPLNAISSCYSNNSVVGCLVYLDDNTAFETWDGVMVKASVTFNVDGNVVRPIVLPMNPTQVISSIVGPSISLDVPRDEELFPTLTLHSQSQVMSRFCSGDITVKSRDSIGAPPGVTIYALDGGVILSDKDEIHNEHEISSKSMLSQSQVGENGL